MTEYLLFVILCLSLFSLISTADQFHWKFHALSAPECAECGKETNPLCAFDFGVIPEVNRSSIATDVCIRFHTVLKPVSMQDVLKKLGNNAVINFVGDSNTRMLFIHALAYFGQPDWFTKLHDLGKIWSNKDTRRTIDHTYLCSGPLGPSNITLSFLWTPFFYESAFLDKRPWSRCADACKSDGSALGIAKCDGSAEEGITERWRCGASLDNPSQDDKRAFVVVSQGGVHDALHKFHGHQRKAGEYFNHYHRNFTLKYDPSYVYTKGQEVTGDFKGMGALFKGEIAAVNADGTYDIQYTRDLELSVPKTRIAAYSAWTGIQEAIRAHFVSMKQAPDVHTESGKAAKCWSSKAFSGREIILSPLHVRRADCNACAATPHTQPGADLTLSIMRNEILRSGIVGSLFDDFVDANLISSEESGAPFSSYDGYVWPHRRRVF